MGQVIRVATVNALNDLSRWGDRIQQMDVGVHRLERVVRAHSVDALRHRGVVARSPPRTSSTRRPGTPAFLRLGFDEEATGLILKPRARHLVHEGDDDRGCAESRTAD
jgi:hypothetical protein